ncbi:MAG TPA: helix-turn-helix transcriptional regulator [Dehalococcoidia bacterium]|nr:helix-turn-helix transcriptional regulator [Dehalococcoidia bacterium]
MRLARNQLEVLNLLAAVDREMAGIEVADAVGGLGRSSAYASLAALQRDGMASARWDVSGPRPRRMFKVTPLGKEALATEKARAETNYGWLAPRTS